MTVRAFVLINPGNPTGQCLTEAELVQLAKFCIKHRLVLMSDEVYQSNVYANSSALPLSLIPSSTLSSVVSFLYFFGVNSRVCHLMECSVVPIR